MKKFLLVILIGIGSVEIRSQEILTLTAPIVKPSQTNVRIERLIIDIPTKTITIQWLGNNNEAGTAVYSTPAPEDHPMQPTGAALLTILNKMNFAGVNPSLVNRILNRLTMDGYLAPGVISGPPE